jgi:hypothetical protein
MAEIADYVRALFYKDLPNVLNMNEIYSRRSELTPSIRKAIEDVLAPYQAVDVIDPEAMAEDVFSDWLAEGIFAKREDPYAGEYFRFSRNKLNVFKQKFLDGSEINAFASVIGSRFYPDVFGGYNGNNPLTDEERASFAVPASDRIVTLQHNQISALEEPIQELVDQLEKDNGIPDNPGLKERLVGQIKAGRELIRSGNFRAYIFHVTIIRALGELIERYKGHAISMVAASLVDMLVQHILQVH